MSKADEEFAMGLNQGGFILFIVLIVVFFPLCFLPFFLDGCKAKS